MQEQNHVAGSVARAQSHLPAPAWFTPENPAAQLFSHRPRGIAASTVHDNDLFHFGNSPRAADRGSQVICLIQSGDDDGDGLGPWDLLASADTGLFTPQDNGADEPPAHLLEQSHERRCHRVSGGDPIQAQESDRRGFTGAGSRDRERQATEECDRRNGPGNLPPRQGRGGDRLQVEGEDSAQSQLRQEREEKTWNGQAGGRKQAGCARPKSPPCLRPGGAPPLSPEESRECEGQDQDQRQAPGEGGRMEVQGLPVRETVIGSANQEDHPREEEGSSETEDSIHRSRREDFGKGQAVPTGVDRRFGQIPSHGAEESDEEEVPDYERAATGRKMNGLVRQPQPEVRANSGQAERHSISGNGQPEPGRAQAAQRGPDRCGIDLPKDDNEEKHGDQQASQSRPRKPFSSKQRMHLNATLGHLLHDGLTTECLIGEEENLSRFSGGQQPFRNEAASLDVLVAKPG